MNILKVFLALGILFIFSGCSVIEIIPMPDKIIQTPIGTSSVKVGMTKDNVRDLWGDPDQINSVEDKEKWGAKREEWVYRARSPLPVDAGYLYKTKKLYFDGINLTNIVEE